MGDSKEQNDSFNMVTIDAGCRTSVVSFEYLNESIDKSDLTLLIDITLNKLFTRVDKNRRAITDRGRGHTIVIVLHFYQIRATITDSGYLKDIKYHVDLSSSSPVSDIMYNLFSDNICPSISGCGDFGSINLNTGRNSLTFLSD